MPPKKKKGKKGKKGKKKDKKGDASEPQSDPSWELAVERGMWDRPIDALPDALQWPTWGALRERILTSCKEIKVNDSPSVRDYFVSELTRLSPPDLHTLSLKRCDMLESVVFSPLSCCPSLKSIDFFGCRNLRYVLIQSSTVETVSIALCPNLRKALLHVRNASRIDVRDLLELQECVIWSDAVDEIDLSQSKKISQLDLHCPLLVFPKVGRLLPRPLEKAPRHAPVLDLVKQDVLNDKYADQVREAHEREMISGVELVPRTFRTL